MTKAARFALVPLDTLRAHEQIDEADLPGLVEEIRARGSLNHPIWVARGSYVILNGHHRVAALRRLGAVRAPVWLIDYHSPSVRVDRWSPGPSVSKEEVEQHAREGVLFPPKTTKHILAVEPGERTTLLADLMATPPAPDGQGRASGPSRRRSGAGASRAR
jgi:L-serine kinase (ADP)